MFETRTCPHCGQMVFSDMDVCYECLYELVSPREDDAGGEQEHEHEVKTEPGEGQGEDMDLSVCLLIRSQTLDVSVPLPKDGLVVGRGSAADVVLHDPAASRRHVRIVPSREGARVSDLGSRNKATIGNVPVLEDVPLRMGETLVVCGTSFTAVRSPPIASPCDGEYPLRTP